MKTSTKQEVKIALMSVADIDNYGDTLFPFIAQQEILKRIPNATFRCFTPTDFQYETQKFYGYNKNRMNEYKPDAILTIGGEVIHRYDDLIWNDMYKNISNLVLTGRTSDTFFDWLNLDCFKAWFSVGVFHLGDEYPKIGTDDLEKLNYIGVRGVLSKKNLEEHLWTYNRSIDVVTDIGWIFPRFAKDYAHIIENLSEQLELNIQDGGYIIFNTNYTAIEVDKINFVKELLADYAQKTGLKVLILPVISSYKDDEFLKQFQCDEIVLLPSNLSLREKTSLLCGAKFYVGSSLHSAITTLAMNKPVAFIHNTQLQKFQDLFSHSMNIKSLSSDWNDLPKLIIQCEQFYENNSLKNAQLNYIKFMQSMFDYKLDELCLRIKENIK